MGKIEELISYSRGIKLLYVEDNPQARESTKTILDEFFSDIVIAVDGEDALQQYNNCLQLAEKKFDLLITDINMPKINGLQLIEQVKKLNPDLPVLVFSAYSESEFFINSIKLGVDGYLLKPFDLNQFIQILGKIVHKIKLQAEAQKSHHLLQQYKEITDKGAIVSIIDTHGIITYANDACCNMVELPINELIGCDYDLTCQYRQSEQLQNEIWTTIRDKKRTWQGETKYVSRSGRVTYLKNTIKPLFDTQGNIVEYIALRSDITEIRLAAKERERLLTLEKLQADESNQAKSAFIASMSHELRTPLNAILGFSHLLQDDNHLSDKQQDYIAEINKAGNNLLQLINGVLELSKVESANLIIALEPVKVIEIIEECMTLFTSIVKQQAVNIHYEIADHYFVQADREALKQVLHHILKNAIIYNNKQGTIKLDIENTHKNKLRISITDTGCGISNDDLNKVFQPFSRLHSRKNEIEGTGVGLSVSKSLIKMMGGRIGVTSQPNKGSTFWLELPVAVQEIAA